MALDNGTSEPMKANNGLGNEFLVLWLVHMLKVKSESILVEPKSNLRAPFDVCPCMHSPRFVAQNRAQCSPAWNIVGAH